jgi:hypothetical protein
MVFITAVSNFYFFYMMVIMTVLYAVWRSVRIHGFRHFGAVILDGISFVWYGLIGTLLSSFIFLPIVLRFLQDPRTADTKQIPLFWPLWYYRNFIDCFLSNGTTALSESWTYMGFGAVALLGVVFIFTQRKKHFDLKAAFIGLTLLLMTPLAGYVMNGFSSITAALTGLCYFLLFFDWPIKAKPICFAAREITICSFEMYLFSFITDYAVWMLLNRLGIVHNSLRLVMQFAISFVCAYVVSRLFRLAAVPLNQWIKRKLVG